MKRLGVLLALFVLTLLVAAPSEAGTIYACKKKIGGTIRIVGARAVCLNTETKISWNTIGPQGPMGPPGNMALAGQQCRGGQVFNGYDLDGRIVCVWNIPNGWFPQPSDLRAYNFRNANMPRVALSMSNLAGVDLSNSFLMGANGQGANLTGANLAGALLQDSNFNGADFSSANLSGANLQGSEWYNVSLGGAMMNGADLTNVRLGGAKGMDSAVLSGVVWLHTQCPDQTLSDTNGTSPESCEGHLTPLP